MGAIKKRPETTDAAEILRRRYIEGKPEMEALLEIERANAAVARQIYQLRTDAGLSQQALARLIGTTASVICRLEDADYEGHSLSMLRRIATALGKEVRISFVTARPVASAPREPRATRAPREPRVTATPRKAAASKRLGRAEGAVVKPIKSPGDTLTGTLITGARKKAAKKSGAPA